MPQRKVLGRPQWMRELRAAAGFDPDGDESVLHRLVFGPSPEVEVVDVVDDPLAQTVAAAARSQTNGPGGTA